MHRGTSIHKAIEEDNKHFMVTGKRLDLSTLFEHGKEEFDKNLKAGVFIPARDIDKTDELIKKARSEMDQSISLYHEMEKQWIPNTVEEFVTYDVGYPLPAVIRIDLIDENHCIYDWKTMAKNTELGISLQDK